MAFLENHVCAACGIEFAAPSHWLSNKRQRGGDFYCPSGHALTFGQSENDKLRLERDLLKQQAARLEDEAHEAREKAERAEKDKQRLKKRASAGVCPCCSRTFSNMARHMKTKHPELATGKVVKLATTKK